MESELPLNETKMRPCWADLLGDMLPIIVEKASTTITEYIHLRAVCKAWQTALTPHPHHLPPQFPWLMLHQPNISDTHVSFYNITQSKINQFQLPHLSGKHCLSSSHGWLVLENQYRVSLLNPITGRCIEQLPSLDAHLLRKGSVPSNQHGGYEYCIRKASLSCTPSKTGCVLVALFLLAESNWELAFCRIGDSHWTELKKSNVRPMVENFALYNNFVYNVNSQLEISVYDLQDHSVWTFPSKLSFHLCVRDYINFVGDACSSGPLIVRMIKCFSEPIVYVYKWCDDWQTWCEVKDIGKRVLFLNKMHSIILQCDEKQENQIYYDVDYRSDPTMESFHVGLNRVNLESGMVVPHKPLWVTHSQEIEMVENYNLVFTLGFDLSRLPLWVTPSLI